MISYHSYNISMIKGREEAECQCICVSIVNDQEIYGSHKLCSVRFDHVGNSFTIHYLYVTDLLQPVPQTGSANAVPCVIMSV